MVQWKVASWKHSSESKGYVGSGYFLISWRAVRYGNTGSPFHFYVNKICSTSRHLTPINHSCFGVKRNQYVTTVGREAINLKQSNNPLVFLTVKSLFGISYLSDLLWFISHSLLSVVMETNSWKILSLQKQSLNSKIEGINWN